MMMKRIVLGFFISTCASFLLSGQDSVYYYSADNGVIIQSEQAQYRKLIRNKNNKLYKITTYSKRDSSWHQEKKEIIRLREDECMTLKSSTDKLFARGLKRCFMKEPDGSYLFNDYRKGLLIRSGKALNLIPLHLHDTIRSFYPDGTLQSVSWYDHNKMMGNNNWLKNGTPYIDNLFYHVNSVPEHSMGGLFFRQYILHGIREAGIDLSQISDKVELGWVIMEDGTLAGLHVISGRFRELNLLLMKLVRELPGEWIPAEIEGQPVRYFMAIPFNFQTPYDSFEVLELSSGFVIWD